MNRKNRKFMRILACMVSLVMIMAFTACGSGPDEEASPEYWVLSGLDMGSGMIEQAEVEEFFQTDADKIMAFRFNPDGSGEAVLFEEKGACSWSETDEGIDVSFEGDDETVLSFIRDEEDNLSVTDEEEGMTMTFRISKTDSVPEVFQAADDVSIDIEYEDDQTAYMSNFMGGGEYVYEDGVIYSHGFDSEGTPILLSFAFDPEKDKADRITDVKYLDEDSWPSYITVKDGCIYYIAHTGDDSSQVCRINTDGSDRTVIYDNNADFLQVDGDRLYFTDENHRLVSTDLEGKGIETLIDREVYCSYHICDDWFVFQDDADEESLHIANSSTGEDRRLSSGRGYGSVIDGSYLYYVDVTDTENYTGNLVKLNLKTMEEERSDVSMHDSLNISRTQMQGYFRGVKVSKDEWNKLEDADQEMSEYYATKYFTDELEIYWYYDADGLITQIAIDADNGSFTAISPKMEEK